MALTRNSDKTTLDLVVPLALALAAALVLPALQTQAWWIVLPCLISLMIGWRLLSFVLLFAAMSYADSWAAGVYFLLMSLLLLMRMSPAADKKKLTTGNVASLRLALTQLLLALPILVLISALIVAGGANWNENPSPNRSGTGISESMSPGSVSALISSPDLVMRVRFDSNASAPLPQDLYWRGLVFEQFDGRTWSRAGELDFDLVAEPVTDSLSYEVALEPTRQFWLYGLHQAHTARANTYYDSRGMLITSVPVRQRIRYDVNSYSPTPVLSMTDQELERNLALPATSNPRTLAWVSEIRQQYTDDWQLTQAVLENFNDQEFYYTFTPALTSGHSVDDFLFETREGFCEHYAGALAFVLRAAGIPARIVAGYQGGDYNNISRHWTVYQYNAHAWVEAWYPGQGWIHLDPVTRVAPDRVNISLDAWLMSSAEELPASAQLRLQLARVPGYDAARHTLDAAQYFWNFGLFDAQGNLRTEELIAWLDERGLGTLPIWMLIGLLLLVGAKTAGFNAFNPALPDTYLRQIRMRFSSRSKTRSEVTLKAYLKFEANLRKQGLGRWPSETIHAHLRRVSTAYPNRRAEFLQLADEAAAAIYNSDNKNEGKNYHITFPSHLAHTSHQPSGGS